MKRYHISPPVKAYQHGEGGWVQHDEAAARIAELESQLVERTGEKEFAYHTIDEKSARIREREDIIANQRQQLSALNTKLAMTKEERDAARTELAAARVNEARWLAVVGCARVRVLGSAGLNDPQSDYAHIGLELWTRYDDAAFQAVGCQDSRDRFTQFADFAVTHGDSQLAAEKGAQICREPFEGAYCIKSKGHLGQHESDIL